VNDPDTILPTTDHLIQSSQLRHIAIIMDGNRRWAKQKHLPALMGHRQGVEALKNIVRELSDIGVEALTVYAFSTENWKRDDAEVGYLMGLFVEALSRELSQLAKNNVVIRFIGDLKALPEKLQEMIADAYNLTKNNTGLKLQIAANYGARHEIMHAAQQLAQDYQTGKIQLSDFTEDNFKKQLYTNDLPDPDLLIRTGGESRLSNYLLWQCAYAEIYITETLWPDFNSAALKEALDDFSNRQRRYGG